MVAATILWAAYGLLRTAAACSWRRRRKHLDPQQVGETLARDPGVVEVHDLHVWEVTTGMPAISAHVIVEPEADCHQARFRAAALLSKRFGVEHSTLQVEHRHDEGELLEIER